MGYTKSLKKIFNIKSFGFIIFFIILSTACQTLSVQDAETRKIEEVKNTQKAMIVSFLNRGLPEMAVKDLRSLMHQYPDDSDFKNLMGLAQLALKNPKEAIGYFKEAYKITPRTSIALNLSSAYIEAGQYSESVNILLSAQKASAEEGYPHPERISHNLGLAAERSKKIKQAEKHYLKALSQNPSFYISLMRLGQLYEHSKKNRKAQTYFQKAKTVCPVCLDPVSAIAMGYMAEGKQAKAQQVVKSYLKQKELSPQDRARAARLMDMTRRAVKPKRAKAQ